VNGEVVVTYPPPEPLTKDVNTSVTDTNSDVVTIKVSVLTMAVVTVTSPEVRVDRMDVTMFGNVVVVTPVTVDTSVPVPTIEVWYPPIDGPIVASLTVPEDVDEPGGAFVCERDDETLLTEGGSFKEMAESEPGVGTVVPLAPCKKQFVLVVFSTKVRPRHGLPALMMLKRSQASIQALNDACC
jgi:hypothetical protein